MNCRPQQEIVIEIPSLSAISITVVLMGMGWYWDIRKLTETWAVKPRRGRLRTRITLKRLVRSREALRLQYSGDELRL